MKRALILDGVAGVSGDMFVGALLAVGADWRFLVECVDSLGVESLKIVKSEVVKGGIAATKFDVVDTSHGGPADLKVSGKHPHRGLSDIAELLLAPSLDRIVASDALAIFTKLAQAEAKVHGVTVEDIHFHEVGALDSIADIICAAAAFNSLSLDDAYCAPPAVGGGVVKSAHGLLPVPAPATVELLRNHPMRLGEPVTNCELTTSTGAALITHFCDLSLPAPQVVVKESGYGAGTRDMDYPNVLRAMVGIIK